MLPKPTQLDYGASPRPSAPEARRVFPLDALRATAALLVCAQHVRNATLIDYEQISNPNPLQRGIYFSTHLGHEAVMIFFVLSGFLVGGSVVRMAERFRFSEYARARLARLWCVLLPCLGLTWLCDHFLLAYAPDVLNGDLADQWHSLPRTGAFDASLSTLLANAVFLQTVAVPIYGSNGPLWSLANEAWYYALFPLLYFCAIRGAPLRRALCAAIACLLLVYMPPIMLALFGVWLMGVSLEFLGRLRKTTSWPRLLAAMLALIASLFLARLNISSRMPSALPDFVIGISSAWLCLCFLRRDATAPARATTRIKHFITHLSDISYSLYLSHFPVTLLIVAIAFHGRRLSPNWTGITACIAMLAVLLFVAHFMWWAFERHTPKLRSWFGKLSAQLRPSNQLP
jgi:peptidoglycan/LPS O-acetylase OafA/YrhL